jgi:hypothetical protein
MPLLLKLQSDIREHTYRCADHRAAQRRATQIRDAINATQYSPQLKHLLVLKSIYTVKVENDLVRIVPKASASVQELTPLPTWAEDSGNGWYIHRSAHTLLELLLAIKEMKADPRMRGVTFPAFDWEACSREKRVTLFEAAREANWSIFEWVGKEQDFALTYPFGQNYSWTPDSDDT